MELTQTQQMLNWLENERVRDKHTISALQERVAGQSNELIAMAKRVQDLETQLAAARAALAKALQFPDLIQQFKEELVAEMDRREDARQKALRESERLHKAEMEALGRNITEVRKELPRLKPLEDDLPMRRAEDRRLAELIAVVTQRVEEVAARFEAPLQSVVYLEESRRQDVKRIAQLEEIVAGHLKRLDALTSKTSLLEDALPRITPRIDEVHKRVDEQNKLIEELRVNEFRRTQDMKGWIEEIERRTAPIPDHVAAFQHLQEQAQINQRYLEEIKGFKERLEGRQAEVAEAQRIAEERGKRQMEEFLTEQEKRWKRFTTEADEKWNAHERIHRPLPERLEAIDAKFKPIYEQLDTLWEIQEGWEKMTMMVAREWRTTYGELAQQRKTLGRPEPGPLPHKPNRKSDKLEE